MDTLPLEIENIIKDYKEQLEQFEAHQQKFSICLFQIKFCNFDSEYYDFNGCIFHCYYVFNDYYQSIEAEICSICGNFFPYAIDIVNSSTTRQYCSCIRNII